MNEILHYDYENATKFTIPAVRAAAAISLSKNHNMDETTIAKSLGIAQAAVSKYLSGTYSAKVGMLVGIIEQKGLADQVVGAILSKKGSEQVANLIDRAATSKSLIEAALKG